MVTKVKLMGRLGHPGNIFFSYLEAIFLGLKYAINVLLNFKDLFIDIDSRNPWGSMLDVEKSPESVEFGQRRVYMTMFILTRKNLESFACNEMFPIASFALT